jgi:SAM-dependent methyltransferase
MMRADVGLGRQERDWDDLALVDPLWAILSETQPGERGWQLDRFFERGEADVESVLGVAQEVGWQGGISSALDFGCGVGRLTRSLAGHFEDCTGVDISERMLEHARRLNADCANCRFLVNRSSDLALFADDTFDFVLSFVVLQHVASAQAALLYISEFVRVTRPGGLVVFQVPSTLSGRNRLQLRRRAYGLLRAARVPPDLLQRRLRLNPMRMIGVSEPEVRRTVEACGGVLARADPDQLAPGIPGFRYFVQVPEEDAQG